MHLRLVLSASELALLPFEQAKTPINAMSCGEGWLSLQARVPVVITRRTRNVSESGVTLPLRPRILFIASDEKDVPFDAHKEALVGAVRPYLKPSEEESLGDGHREQYGDALTILKAPTFDQVVKECATQRYTHIHILAHGAKDPASEDTSYGLVLDGKVISGERLASAFARLVGNAIHRPFMVVLATCDSGNVGSVVIPGASIAHVLHQAGIPMVVASQFPLSKVGSELVVNELYPGLLCGENPWILLHRIRTGLHGCVMEHSHDWASLVVYEALPANLDSQLEELRYYQGKRAMDAALARIDNALPQWRREKKIEPVQLEEHEKAVQRAIDWLPMKGCFATECMALRGSSKKRLAAAWFDIALSQVDDAQLKYLKGSLLYLEQSLNAYKEAVDSILVIRPGQPQQRMASLHWVLVQQLCLSTVLGGKMRKGAWEAAHLSAEAYLNLQNVDERAWALGSLTELWLLKVADWQSSEAAREHAARQAYARAAELADLYPSSDVFPIQSTRRQLNRYTEWWSHSLIENLIQEKYKDFPTWKELGVVRTAQGLIEILDGRSSLGRIAWDVEAERPSAIEAPAPEAAITRPATAAVPAEVKLRKPAQSQPKRPAAPAPDRAGAFFHIEMLPANEGDCLWLEYGADESRNRILIDCGTERTYQFLQARIDRLAERDRKFELFILSHIDSDHIGGAIPFLEDKSRGVSFGDVWFNGWKHLNPRLGALQGEQFSTLLVKHQHPWNEWRGGKTIVVSGDELPACTLPGGMQLTLLSPSAKKLDLLRVKWKKDIEEKRLVPGDPVERLGKTVSTSTDVEKLAASSFKCDAAPHNGSSIAVLAEFQSKSVLLGADAHPDLLVDSIQKLCRQRGISRLRVDAIKIPHHGSQNNLNVDLVEQVECKNYLISTDGSKGFNHPDREAIARVIRHGGPEPLLWFNYRSSLNEVWSQPELQEKYRYSTAYPSAERPGLVVKL